MGSAGENIPSESHTMPTWIAIWDEKNSERFAPSRFLTNYRGAPTMALRLWLSVQPGLFFWGQGRRWEISW